MDRYNAALKIWKELAPAPEYDQRLEQFALVLQHIKRLPEGTDLTRCVELIGRTRTWLDGATLEYALEHVVDAVCTGLDPASIDESLRFIVQSQGGFTLPDAAMLAFRYTIVQLKTARNIWESLPAQDRAAIQVDTLLEQHLEDQPELVALVLEQMHSLRGAGLKVARLLQEAISPEVALELWWSTRAKGPVKPMDYEMLQRAINLVGLRPRMLEEGTEVFLEGHASAVLFSQSGYS